MVRKSVLSGVLDQTREMSKAVGAEDRARLDQYFTGLRDLERQFDQQLTKPEPIAACRPVASPGPDPRPGSMPTSSRSAIAADRPDGDGGRLRPDPRVQHGLLRRVRLDHQAGLREAAPHHHARGADRQGAGYQPNASWFTRRAMEEWAYFVEAFAKVREGDGTLLDNMLIYASTDQLGAHPLDRRHPDVHRRARGRPHEHRLHIDGGGRPRRGSATPP